MSTLFHTHEVTNQPPPLSGYDVFGADVVLAAALEREGAAWARDELHALGRLAGSDTEQELDDLNRAVRVGGGRHGRPIGSQTNARRNERSLQWP